MAADHPNVRQVLDFRCDDPGYYIAMEFLSGLAEAPFVLGDGHALRREPSEPSAPWCEEPGKRATAATFAALFFAQWDVRTEHPI
jgi:hypothetical protein